MSLTFTHSLWELSLPVIRCRSFWLAWLTMSKTFQRSRNNNLLSVRNLHSFLLTHNSSILELIGSRKIIYTAEDEWKEEHKYRNIERKTAGTYKIHMLQDESVKELYQRYQ